MVAAMSRVGGGTTTSPFFRLARYQSNPAKIAIPTSVTMRSEIVLSEPSVPDEESGMVAVSSCGAGASSVPNRASRVSSVVSPAVSLAVATPPRTARVKMKPLHRRIKGD